MRRATIGLWSLLLLVGVAVASAGQNPPASADGQKLEAAWAFVPIEGGGHFAVFMKSSAFLDQLVSRVLPLAAR
jgi:hypothetical protein